MKRSHLLVCSFCAYGGGVTAYLFQQNAIYPLLGGWMSGVLLMMAFQKEALNRA